MFFKEHNLPRTHLNCITICSQRGSCAACRKQSRNEFCPMDAIFRRWGNWRTLKVATPATNVQKPRKNEAYCAAACNGGQITGISFRKLSDMFPMSERILTSRLISVILDHTNMASCFVTGTRIGTSRVNCCRLAIKTEVKDRSTNLVDSPRRISLTQPEPIERY